MHEQRGARGRAALAAAAVAAAAAAAVLALAATPGAYAEPYMSVSADDESSGRTVAGAMVVEVVVSDPDLRSTGRPSGEPSVTVDGEPLRMVQGGDGSWYAYFADAGAAAAADRAAGAPGEGMDFGEICPPAAAEPVLGASFADAEAVAVARAAGGCTGPLVGEVINNVVRRAPRVNAGGGDVPPGQIGIDPDAWPVVQLYPLGGSFAVEYERAGGTERAELEYDEIPNAAMSLDRERYPAGAEVHVTISDAQLNQDPTDRDVWTFSTDPRSPGVFYMGGGAGGSGGGGGAQPAANLHPHLRAIGFEDNGALTIDAGRTVSFKPNGIQAYGTVETPGEGAAYSNLVTVRETRASSSVFVSHDGSGESTVWVPRGAPRGTAAVFEYNDGAVSAVTGPSTASIGIGPAGGAAGGGGGQPAPGTRATVSIADADRNSNPSRRDVMSASEPAPVPHIVVGSPLTLDGADGAWHAGGDGRIAPADYSAIDAGRLAVARPGAGAEATALVVSAGYGADAVHELRGGPSARSTTWLNYDVRSLAGPGGLSGATIGMSFGGRAGLAGAAPAAGPPDEAWDASAGRGTVRVIGDHSDGRGGVVFTVSVPAGLAGAEEAAGDAAVHLDLFSFGSLDGGRGGIINNAVYRLELEETAAASGVFEGTIEYVVIDGHNAGDAAFAASLVPYGDDARIAAGGDMTGDDAVTVSYEDVAGAGGAEPVAADADAPTHSGSVHLGAASYGFGRPVTITVVDADLNTNHDGIETYHVDNDESSPHVDAVASGGAILLEVTIKGERYRRCTVDGVGHGGLAASGFALVETGPATGVFEGTFKMPSWICSADGSRLVSPAGGKIDARYHDYADGRGGSSIVDASPRRAGGGGGVGAGEAPAAAAGRGTDGIDVGAGGSAGEEAPAAAGQGTGGIDVGVGGGAGEAGPAAAEGQGTGGPAGREPDGYPIPAGARQVAMLRGEQMSDAELVYVVRSAVEAGGGYDGAQRLQGGAAQTLVPAWFKTVAGWWGDGRISDIEIVNAARYVLDMGTAKPPE